MILQSKQKTVRKSLNLVPDHVLNLTQRAKKNQEFKLRNRKTGYPAKPKQSVKKSQK